MARPLNSGDLARLRARIEVLARELGFDQVGVAGIDLAEDEANLERWLAESRNGGMEYMARHGQRRSRPEALVPGTLRVISVRMAASAPDASPAADVLADGSKGYVARYALGRDYHKVLRSRLAELAARLEAEIGPFGHRAFVDSGPVMEKPLARNAGLGWIGKHTNLINERAGSLFMLGELFTDLPLPVDERAKDRCGSCSACLPACPTGAITAPYQLDARRCISYLTIEHHGSIPEGLRAAIGNRIFGCDDCQLVCPWNKFARVAAEPDFRVRHSTRRGRPRRALCLERGGVPRKDRGQRAAQARLPALAAQHRGRARQCAAVGARAGRAAGTRRRRRSRRARARRLGARRRLRISREPG